MACLNVTPGLFFTSPAAAWQYGVPATTPAGHVITSTPGGASPGLSIARAGGGTTFFAQPLTGRVDYVTWGDFVLVQTISDVGSALPATRTIVHVDLTTAALSTTVLSTVNVPSTTGPANVNQSAGNGTVFLLWVPMDSGSPSTVSAQICRSDNGDTLCSAVPFAPTMQILGNATATQLQILEGAMIRASCALPSGNCHGTPNPRNFPDAVIGTAMASNTQQFTIQNTGMDCLVVSAIGDVAPYSKTGTSMTLPATLAPSASMTVDVLFAPAAVGTYNAALPITRNPANGDDALHCHGLCRNPIVSISFPGTIGFGTVPVGTSPTRNLVITNNGEVPVTVNLAAGASGPFSWAGFSGALNPGANSGNIVITYSPVTETTDTATINFTSTAPGSPHAVHLSGTGCVARAHISIVSPAGPVIDLGNVERGFRTVAIVTVHNTGNGPLNFRATTTGSPLFGLANAGDPVTSPASTLNFSVNPISACGPSPTGSGSVSFGVTFFANDVPGLVTGTLTIDNHNDASAPASFTFNLQGTIIAAVNVDTEVVLDRSGSMGDPSGPRTKIATAIDAAHLFIQLGRADVSDRLGIVKFNTTPEVVTSITEITSGGGGTQAAMLGAVNASSLNPTGGTSIAGGTMTALRDMANNPRPTAPPVLHKSVIVLTDGQDNTAYHNPDDGLDYTILGDGGSHAIPVPADTKIYALGIGDSIDTGRLGTLASGSGGHFLAVHDFSGTDYFQLEKYFTQIYMETVDLASVVDPVYTILPNTEQEWPVDVLVGDVGMMVVIYDKDGVRLPFYLESPKHEIVDLTSVPAGFHIRPGVTETARFIEVKFPENEPDRHTGVWIVHVVHDGQACSTRGTLSAATTHQAGVNIGQFGPGFRPKTCKPSGDPIMYGIAIGVGSDFRMMPYVDPAIVHIGDPVHLNAIVTEFGEPATGCTVTVHCVAPDGAVTDMTLSDDGAHGDDDSDDGNYGGDFTRTFVEGTYNFTFRTTGLTRDNKPVVREAMRSKYVEGRVPLIPTTPTTTGGGTTPTPTDDECCKQNRRWLMIVALLLLLILLAILFRH